AGRAIAQAHPDHFRWWTGHQCSLVEVFVLRDDHEPVVEGVAPNFVVGRIAKSDPSHVRRVGELLGDSRYQPTRDVRIEEQLQAPETSLRSRSAANAKQARMSSCSSSGKSARISSSVIPDAR